MESKSFPCSVEFLDEQASDSHGHRTLSRHLTKFHKVTLAMRGEMHAGVSRAVHWPARLSPAPSGKEGLNSQSASPGAGWGSGLARYRLLRVF